MNVSEYIETVIAEVKATLSHTILTSVSTRIRVNLGYFEGTATSSSANSLPATAHQVAMELSRISTKHRGSSTGPTKNFRETCFTYTTNAQWHYAAPTLAWQYHFISCEGIQLGICFTLKGEDVVKHFQKKFRWDGWQLVDFLGGMKTRSKPAQVKHELLLS